MTTNKNQNQPIMKVTLGTQERPYINREREREFIKKREGERERSTNICDISNLFFPYIEHESYVLTSTIWKCSSRPFWDPISFTNWTRTLIVRRDKSTSATWLQGLANIYIHIYLCVTFIQGNMNTRQQIQNKKKPKKPYSNLLGNKCIHVCVCNLYTGNHEYKATNSE